VQTLGIILSLLFAFVPMLVFACIVYWTDRYEKEPRSLLGGVFLWGAVVAAGFSFLINTTAGIGIYSITHSQEITELSTSIAIAPVVEELLIGLACLLVYLFFRHEFDSILDGIVYASITALGFAATENFYYIYNYGFHENGLPGILTLFLVRVILIGWQHPFFTAFTGIGLAISRLNRKPPIKILAPIIGLSLAIFTHSFHNTISTLLHGTENLLIGILYDWSGWIVLLLFICWALYRERRWIIVQLGEEVSNGIITPSQYKTACSAWAQVGARLRSVFTGKYRLTSHFYQLTAELAYKKYQASSLGEQTLNQPVIDRLRYELEAMSSQLLS
jgi:RsiW-degrading membrane proteinase PrsW (M82 family)